MSGRIDMDAVIVGIADICIYLAAVKPHIVAVMHPVTPSGRLIDHGHIDDPDIGATGKEAGPWHRLLIRDNAVILPPGPVRILLRSHEHISVAVYLSPSRDGYVISFVCINQSNVSPARNTFPVKMAGCLPVRIVFQVRRTEEHSIRIYEEFDSALEFHSTGQKGSSGENHPSAAGLRHGVYRLLKHLCDLGLAVGLRAI